MRRLLSKQITKIDIISQHCTTDQWMSVARYQGLIADLELYLNHEILEWRSIAESSTDRRDFVTFDALLDLKDELDRLKSLYFPTEDKQGI